MPLAIKIRRQIGGLMVRKVTFTLNTSGSAGAAVFAVLLL
jgi:hypothetical protein